LDDIKASAPSLPLHDLKALTGALSETVKAQEAQRSRKALRLQRLGNAMAAQADDPLTNSKVATCRGELRRLGFGDINALSANGVDLHDLDRRMKDAGWDAKRKIARKGALDQIGMLAD
jgi:hypothetical protein